MQDVDAPQSKKKRLVTSGLRGGGGSASTAVCVGCGGHILDQYILRVAPDLEWHAACLKCAECHVFLDETCTCFVRAGKTYCKHDYVRLFGAKCAKCLRGFDKSDFVMRAKNKIFHMDCFRCVACTRHLVPGDEFALRDDGLFCRADSDIVDKSGAVNNNLDEIEIDTKANILNNNNNEKAGSGAGSPNSTDSRTTSSGGGGGGGGGRKKDGHKTTRVRTVLNEKQLHTLRTCYNANPRPDALMKEQLVEMTNLSPRVIRVWFQNKRCKDKKRSIALKQMQQQQQEKWELNNNDGEMLLGDPITDYRLLQQGVPMIASSPVRHEPPPGLGPGGPVEVQSYQAPWKALSEFANMGGGGGDMEQPPFQQLVSSFGPGPESASDDDDSIMTLEDQQQHGGGGPPVSMAGLLGPPPPPHGLHLHHGGHHPGGPPPPHMLMHDLDAKC